MPTFRIVLLAIVSVIVFGVTSNSEAQPDVSTCPALVERALDALENNCEALDRNVACYGFNRVDATFTQAVEAEFFTRPSDRAELRVLQAIQTAALDLENGIWGIAVMSVQANIPNTLPGQSVIFLLLGDALVENQVDPDEALLPAEPVAVTARANVEARSGPGLHTNVVGGVQAGTQLEADALNRDGDWLRVLLGDRPAWVMRNVLSVPENVDELPVVSATSRTPMQAFYFSTGFGQPTCNEAPDVVTVRSPENLNVEFTVNGIDVSIGSTITFKNVSENQIAITVQEGTLQLVTGEVIEAGQTIIATVDEEGNIISFDEVRPATEEELLYGEISDALMERLGLFIAEDDAEVTGELIHIVAPGETMFSIAQLYNASIPAIMARNGIANANTIFVGQRLVIPFPGSGFVGAPSDPITGNGDIAPGVVDCTPFRATSPLDGLAFGTNTFYWDAVPGATSYRVIVYNNTEGGSVSFETQAPATSLTALIDQSNIGGGFDFSWEVQALLDGVVACTSSRITTQRSAPPTLPPPPPPPRFTTSWACTGDPQMEIDEITVFFSGAQTGELVTVNFMDQFEETRSGEAFGPSNTIVFPDVWYAFGGVVTRGDGSRTQLPDLDCDGEFQSPMSPVASFSFGCDGFTCSFDATGSFDPDGFIVSYSWDFGDETTGAGATVLHTYEPPCEGTFDYPVTLVVTDNDNLTDTDQDTVSITIIC
jgi:LysM repeat protein